MRVLLLVMCVIVGAARTALAQAPTAVNTPPPLELDRTPQRPVLLTPREAIRAADDPVPEGLTPIQQAMQARERIYNGMVSVELSVVLNQNGRVDSAKPIRGPERFYERAEEIEMHRAFEPARDKDGAIVRAHFTDYVSVEPPERWLDHQTAFPEHVDLSAFRISLERTSCFGTCPPYRVTVAGSGEVTWEGGQFVAAPGTHHAKISHDAVRELVDQARGSHILNALDEYHAGWTDSPTYTVTLEVNGVHKQVVDYIGTIVGMPTSIRELEEAIDQTAGTQRWIKGNADLAPALVAEHWDFGAGSGDNLQLYDGALERGDHELLAAFVAAHGPVFSADAKIKSPVCVSSGLADAHAALEMLATVLKDRKLPQHTMDECLVDAARGGNVDLIEVWLKRGASLNPAAPPNTDGEYVPVLETPLLAAVQGGSPLAVKRLLAAHAALDAAQNGGHNSVTYASERCGAKRFEDKEAIVKMLMEAGADPNQEAEYDRPALFGLYSEPELVEILVAGGAKVNQRDGRGITPLMSATQIEVLKALLEAGADPTLRNSQGQTAGEQFRAEGLTEQADILDAAVKARLGPGHVEGPAAKPAP